MKRSVAILGHTPQFVRWAIRKACPLRELSENLADDSFRQLRGLRAFSVGRAEGRVVDGVCVHPAASAIKVDEARGFFAAEVLDAHGGEHQVDQCCHGCEANALADAVPGVWAGCYGWLPANNDFQFDVSQEAKVNEQNGLDGESNPMSFVILLDRSIDELGLASRADQLFQLTSPRWYGIWQNRSMSNDQIGFLKTVFDHLVDQLPCPSDDVKHFRNALRLCFDHQLGLSSELVPPGFSDGQAWIIERCCPDCSYPTKTPGDQNCPGCGRFGSPLEVRKHKVLGIRPYVFLKGVIGEPNTAKLLAKLETKK